MDDIEIDVATPSDPLDRGQRRQLRDFLATELGEYGDRPAAIMKAIDFSMGESGSEGGYIVRALSPDQTMAAVVINETGMTDYIPENVLVYIAVGRDHRGHGLGKRVLEKAQEHASGGIALHVEQDNPAIHLFESLGFEHRYLEMRWEPNNR